MKKYKTVSDIGSLLFGTEDFGVTVFNRFGDCTNTVLVFESDAEYRKFVKDNDRFAADPFDKFHIATRIEGKFNLYNYDCAERTPENVKCKFDGRYFVYVRCEEYEYPTIAVVKQEDRR